MNIYRGCTHGCIYCDSRSRCYQIDHPFEDVEVKVNAPVLLDQALSRKRERCMIGTGSMSDPYMPCEGQLMLTRRCLEIIRDHGFGATVITKSDRILRDLDLLRSIGEQSKCVVQMTLTTYDEDLCRVVEPNAPTTRERFEVLKVLRDHQIPTVVWLCPILPMINDTEDNIAGLLSYCAEARVYGILCFGMGMTLREGNREYFYQKLDLHFPGLKEAYIRKFGYRYSIGSDNNAKLMDLLKSGCRQHSLRLGNDEIFRYLQTFEDKQQDRQLRFF